MKKHVVQPGDTLWKIAKAYGVPLASVITANPQIADPDKIEVGMTINVPAEWESPVVPPVPEGDAASSGEVPDAEMPFDPFTMSEGIKMTQYVVQSGDTLWKIAQKTGYSLAHIIAANPQIANPDMIMPGQVINIPDMEGTHKGMPYGFKEKLTMPKEMVTAPKGIKTAPMPPMPQPVHHHHHHHHQDVDVMMLDYHPMTLEYHPFLFDYHPHYLVQPPVKVEVKHPPKEKHMKPMMVKPVYPLPCPMPVYSPCPPGTHPFLMDELGNLYPYPGYLYPEPYMVPTAPAPYMARPAVPPLPYGGTVPLAAPAMYTPLAQPFSEAPQATVNDWHKAFPAMPQPKEPEDSQE